MPDRPESSQLDHLVPPVGPRWRPVALLLVALVATIGVTYAWGNGRVTPMLDEPRMYAWGGDDPVYLGIELQARGGVELVDIWEPPPGLSLRSVQVIGEDRSRLDAATVHDWQGLPLPAALPSGETVLLLAVYDVVDCARLDSTPLDVVLRRDLGPMSITRTRGLESHTIHWTVEREVPRDEVGPGTSDPIFQHVPVGWAEGITFAVC